MSLTTAYLFLLSISVSLLLMQLFVVKKRLVHIFFALFCASLAMVAIKHLSADSLGPYQYIVGLGTCVTCNGIWLVSRALFKGDEAISKHHILFAATIALLVMSNQSVQFASELAIVSPKLLLPYDNAMSEITNLLSSTVLALTAWEALRNFTQQKINEKIRRIIFLGAYSIGILLCTVVANAFFSPQALQDIFPWFVVVSASTILITSQALIWWKDRDDKLSAMDESKEVKHSIDSKMIKDIESLLIKDKIYLNANLKMKDLTTVLDVSEYKISRAVRFHFGAANFTSFINTYRLAYAENLLLSPSSKEWSILVIAMESGFNSLSSFNRIFKNEKGISPKQFKEQSLLSHDLLESGMELLADTSEKNKVFQSQ